MVGIVRFKFHELYVPVHVAGDVRTRRRTWMRLRSPRIKEERRRLKELERTLWAELKDVTKRAPDEKLLFGKPLCALEGGKAAGRRDRSRSLGHSYSRSVFLASLEGRNQRELLKLAEALDRKAWGDYGRAADVLSQRFKAIEVALHDGEWS